MCQFEVSCEFNLNVSCFISVVFFFFFFKKFKHVFHLKWMSTLTLTIKNSICFINYRELDLSGNLLRGPLTENLLPTLKSLDSLNLGTNLFTSIRTGAFEKFPFLTRLTLRHNQIDVLQDHSFSGLGSLQMLDLSYNGIVAISGASLKHLSRLLILNLTHNFLRFVLSHLFGQE